MDSKSFHLKINQWMPEYLSQHESLIFAESFFFFFFFIPTLMWKGQEIALNAVQKMTHTSVLIQILTTALEYGHTQKTEGEYTGKEDSYWLKIHVLII